VFQLPDAAAVHVAAYVGVGLNSIKAAKIKKVAESKLKIRFPLEPFTRKGVDSEAIRLVFLKTEFLKINHGPLVFNVCII